MSSTTTTTTQPIHPLVIFRAGPAFGLTTWCPLSLAAEVFTILVLCFNLFRSMRQ